MYKYTTSAKQADAIICTKYHILYHELENAFAAARKITFEKLQTDSSSEYERHIERRCTYT